MPDRINLDKTLENTPAIRTARATEKLSDEIVALRNHIDMVHRESARSASRLISLVTMIIAALGFISSVVPVVFGIIVAR